MNMSPAFATSSLRRIIAADAAICAATSLLMVFGAGPIADLTGLPVALLRIAGLVIVPYVVFLIALLRRDPVPRNGALAATGINLAWAVGCVAVLASGKTDPNGLGVVFILVQMAAVLLFAVLQYRAADQEYSALHNG